MAAKSTEREKAYAAPAEAQLSIFLLPILQGRHGVVDGFAIVHTS